MRKALADSANSCESSEASSTTRLLFRSTTILLLSSLAACTPIVRVSLLPFYPEAPLAPDVVVTRNVSYAPAGPDAHPRQSLDLYRPRNGAGSTLLFVHGGSFDRGDKDLEIAGLDIYGNIGRFYASRGIAVVLVGYRLQPEVDWPDQVDDVAAALAWTIHHLRERGDPDRVVLVGHSAGAWLTSRLALDEGALARHGLEPGDIDGVVALSGSGYDLTDRRTWEMYPREDWWSQRFERPDARLPWQQDASIVPLIDERAPAFLLLHSDSEPSALERQNRLFFSALRRSGVVSRLIAVDHGSHRRIVLAMSREDREVTEHILAFVRSATMQGP